MIGRTHFAAPRRKAFDGSTHTTAVAVWHSAPEPILYGNEGKGRSPDNEQLGKYDMTHDQPRAGDIFLRQARDRQYLLVVRGFRIWYSGEISGWVVTFPIRPDMGLLDWGRETYYTIPQLTDCKYLGNIRNCLGCGLHSNADQLQLRESDTHDDG